MRTRQFKMTAKTMANLEDVLAQELIELGANNVELGNRLVFFEGDLSLLYRANFHCRTALSILRPVYEFRAKNTDEIYARVKAMNWAEHLDDDSSFAIDSVVFSDTFTHSNFVTHRVKDAIVDYFMQRTGKRPTVSTESPDLLINFHISHNQCTLSFDSSGESLHKRGYRVEQTIAPINEVLAAGMILKTGWRGETDFIDPMCGSGTFLIEAAMIAMNTPPGIYRKEYAFEKWKNFNPELFDFIYNDDSGERDFKHTIYGSDISLEAVEIAKRNVKVAGLERHIQIEQKDMKDYEEAPSEKAIMVTNPPYGERLVEEDILALYEMIGERLKHVFMGHSAWIIAYNPEHFHKIGLRHSKRIPLINGALDCEYRKYDIFAGKRTDFKRKKKEKE